MKIPQFILATNVVQKYDQELGLSKATYYRYLQWAEQEEKERKK